MCIVLILLLSIAVTVLVLWKKLSGKNSTNDIEVSNKYKMDARCAYGFDKIITLVSLNTISAIWLALHAA